MIERFREPERAVAYLCLAMQEFLAENDVDVTWHQKSNVPPSTQTVEGRRLALALERACGKFVEATAIFGMELAGYPIGAIQCRCSKAHRAACSYHCQHHDERPIVCVMAFSKDNPPSFRQRQEAARLLRAEIYRSKEAGENHVRRFYRG